MTGDGCCEYTICKLTDDICRIRFDFNTFNIAGPQVGTTVSTVATAVSTDGGAIGDCVTDSFSITAPGEVGSPVICGFNTGQHMIVDASDCCHKVTFDIGGGATTREWDIKVTQYSCASQDGGPDGCLQYLTGTSGTIASYNFPTTASSVTSTATHLSNQLYTVCWRQERGFCGVCFLPVTNGATAAAVVVTAQISFGVSIGSTTGTAPGTATGGNDSACLTDYVEIPGGAAAVTPAGAHVNTANDRFCGRFFGPGAAAAATNTVCTYSKPLRIVFRTDADEITSGVAEDRNEHVSDATTTPGGILGFNLAWTQQSC